MTGITIPPASVSASEADLFGALEPTGPRLGADSGEPTTWTRVLTDVGPVQVGIWECTPGGWPIENRPNTEIVHVLRGAARITDRDGSVRELSVGSVVVLPVGWSGRWDITETIRKLYVTIEA
jgi:uncharacterized protein